MGKRGLSPFFAVGGDGVDVGGGEAAKTGAGDEVAAAVDAAAGASERGVGENRRSVAEPASGAHVRRGRVELAGGEQHTGEVVMRATGLGRARDRRRPDRALVTPRRQSRDRQRGQPREIHEHDGGGHAPRPRRPREKRTRAHRERSAHRRDQRIRMSVGTGLMHADHRRDDDEHAARPRPRKPQRRALRRATPLRERRDHGACGRPEQREADDRRPRRERRAVCARMRKMRVLDREPERHEEVDPVMRRQLGRSDRHRTRRTHGCGRAERSVRNWQSDRHCGSAEQNPACVDEARPDPGRRSQGENADVERSRLLRRDGQQHAGDGNDRAPARAQPRCHRSQSRGGREEVATSGHVGGGFHRQRMNGHRHTRHCRRAAASAELKRDARRQRRDEGMQDDVPGVIRPGLSTADPVIEKVARVTKRPVRQRAIAERDRAVRADERAVVEDEAVPDRDRIKSDRHRRPPHLGRQPEKALPSGHSRRYHRPTPAGPARSPSLPKLPTMRPPTAMTDRLPSRRPALPVAIGRATKAA